MNVKDYLTSRGQAQPPPEEMQKVLAMPDAEYEAWLKQAQTLRKTQTRQGLTTPIEPPAETETPGIPLVKSINELAQTYLPEFEAIAPLYKASGEDIPGFNPGEMATARAIAHKLACHELTDTEALVMVFDSNPAMFLTGDMGRLAAVRKDILQEVSR